MICFLPPRQNESIGIISYSAFWNNFIPEYKFWLSVDKKLKQREKD